MDFDWLLNGPAIGFQVAYCHVRQSCMCTKYSALPHLQNNMPLIKRVKNSVRMQIPLLATHAIFFLNYLSLFQSALPQRDQPCAILWYQVESIRGNNSGQANPRALARTAIGDRFRPSRVFPFLERFFFATFHFWKTITYIHNFCT